MKHQIILSNKIKSEKEAQYRSYRTVLSFFLTNSLVFSDMMNKIGKNTSKMREII
ncbi:inositol-5-monophosphate dehydrogenase [Carnobacterium sp. AT7]|nr:inositol-5-monophosphate dehydrogenase [Carnobacterium sp. AT7]